MIHFVRKIPLIPESRKNETRVSSRPADRPSRGGAAKSRRIRSYRRERMQWEIQWLHELEHASRDDVKSELLLPLMQNWLHGGGRRRIVREQSSFVATTATATTVSVAKSG